MDPVACLARASNAASDRDWTEVRAALSDYREWRAKGGFEPIDGDKLADMIARRAARKAHRSLGFILSAPK